MDTGRWVRTLCGRLRLGLLLCAWVGGWIGASPAVFAKAPDSVVPEAAPFPGEPQYSDDPFGDERRLAQAELIATRKHATENQVSFALLYSAGLADKFSRHQGVMADVLWMPWQSIGFGVTVGYLQGAYRSIVDGSTGIFASKLQACRLSAGGCNTQDLGPNVPDVQQITGVASAYALWAPLYGKINWASSWQLGIQLYLLAGAGAHGSRQVTTTANADFSGFTSQGGNFGDGGMFASPRFHGVVGAGSQLFLTKHLALRGEFRMLLFRSHFVFDPNIGREAYLATHGLGQVGLVWAL